MLKCLEDIVGVLNPANITTVITQGLTTDEIAALKVSTSKLFLDDLPGGVTMKALIYADVTRKFSSMATAALMQAKKDLEADLTVAINNTFKKSRKSYTGQIGLMSYAATLPANGRWQGVRIRAVEAIDGILTISRINVILNGAAAFKLRLFEVETTAGGLLAVPKELENWDINAVANQFFTLDLAGEATLNLPLARDGYPLEYWVLYDRNELPGNVLPKDTKLICTTCPGARSSLGEFAEVYGVGFNDISNLNSGRNTDNYSRGLIIDVAVGCNNGSFFCREYNEQEAVAVCMAYAVWFHAGELLIESIMKEPDVNRYTLQDHTYLWGKRNHFRKEYQDRIPYLAATVDVTASNCYVCREAANKPIKGRILS